MKQDIQYANPWHKPNDATYGPAIYSRRSVSVKEHGEFRIVKVSAVQWDLVWRGYCVTQRAGYTAISAIADAIEPRLTDPETAWRVCREDGPGGA